MMDLTNHVAVITGGNGGLGLAMAKGLVKANAKIAIWGRNSEKNEFALSELKELGGDVKSFTCDVTNEENVKEAMASTVSSFGKIDSFFANAGGGGVTGPLHELSMDDWRFNVDLNLTSVILTFQAAIREFLKQQSPGKLIVTSSAAAIVGTPRNTTYSATKAAVNGLIRALAIELGPMNIQANAILPGYIETEMSLNTPAIFRETCIRRTANGKGGQLEDMEGIAVYLASQQSNYMTGQSIVLDGGQSVNVF